MLLRTRREEFWLHLMARTDMATRSLDLRLRYLIDHPIIKCPLTVLSVDGIEHTFRGFSLRGPPSSQVLRVDGHRLIIISCQVLIHGL
jgi:hypothetical protein